MTYSLSTRKARVLIVSPPYRLSQASFPLGLMYIASSLQRAGHVVEVIDMDAVNLSEEAYLSELRSRDYDFLCIGGMITAWNFVMFTCQAVKEINPQVRVIVGGGLISSTPNSFISVSPADVGVIGEGEDTILEVVNAFLGDQSLAEIPGIVYRADNQAIETDKRVNLPDLDSLAYPAWELFNVKDIYSRFPSHNSVIKARRTATISTTRGCPYMCTFCYTEKSVRQRSVEGVIDEMKQLKERYGVRHFTIADDLFVVRKKRTIEFCDAMIKHKMNVTWSATGRCNIIDPDFCRLMYDAGCRFMGLGIESGSESVLNSMKKSQSPKQIVEAVKMVQKAGITPGGTFILGLPTETRETVRETVNIYKEINTYRYHVNKFFFATPYPGTELYDEMKLKGRIGDEIAFFEKISERGDAVDFLINCTDTLTDDELIQTKQDIEAEVLADFAKKHPWIAFQSRLSQTPWAKIRKILIMFKLNGPLETCKFLWQKLVIYLRIVPNRYERKWNRKVSYSASQNIVESEIASF